jgi:hypothetical protein
MKRMIFTLITAAVIIAGTAGCDAEMPAKQVGSGTYKLVDHFPGDTSQGPAWFYMVRVGGGDWQELNYYPDYGDNWQYSTDPEGEGIYFSIFTWEGIVTVGSGRQGSTKYEVGVAFRAVEAGKITIPDFMVKSHGEVDPADDPPGPVNVVISDGSSVIESTNIATITGEVRGKADIPVGAGQMI